MKCLWCVTKDWDSPAGGEKWHKAKSVKTAAAAGVRYIRKNTSHYVGGYLRFVLKRDGSTVVDFGNHVWFILVKKEETKEGEGGTPARAAHLRNGDVGSALVHGKEKTK